MSAVHRLMRGSCDDVLLNVISTVVLCTIVIVPTAFILSRMHMMHRVYNDMSAEREDSAWLSEQCKFDEFYHNMKQHSTLCDDLSARRRDSIFLNAAEHVIENSYLCGFTSCSQTLEDIALWAMGRGVVATGLFLLMCMSLPSILLPCFRRWGNNMADTRMRALHHAPYGQETYMQTAFQHNLTPWQRQAGEEHMW